MSEITYSHPSIGEFVASTRQEGVLQFLGVQYATLADRFAPAVLKKYPVNGAVNAAKHGPQVHPGGADHEFKLLQQTLPYDPSNVQVSETECLNLNITVPVNSTGKPLAEKLPVFVFIHGGGFRGGSANFPQYDLARIVRLSVESGAPMIAVGFNYRLGITGFLTSKAMREVGYKPNNGIRDQRTALLWLKQYIHAFSGNADDVTLMGESAGAVSVAYHLHSQQPLFKRAMLMSGTTLLVPPMPEFIAEDAYTKAAQALALSDLSPADCVAELREMDLGNLSGKLMQAGVITMPTIDGEICPVGVDWKSLIDGTIPLKAKDWCESVIIGDCAFDGSINVLRFGHRKTGIAKSFHAALSTSLPEQTSTKLFQAYGLRADTSDEDAFVKILEVSNDIQFYAPTVAFAGLLAEKSEVFVYRFNEPNTWPGMFEGRTTHIHDLVFLLQNFNEKLSDVQKALATGFAGDVVRFVNGKAPWQAWKREKNTAKVYQAGQAKVVDDVPSETGRRSIVFELADEVGWDVYSEAFGSWARG